MDNSNKNCPNCQLLATRLLEGTNLLLEMEEECFRMEQGRRISQAAIESVVGVLTTLTAAQIESIHPKAPVMLSNLQLILAAMNGQAVASMAPIQDGAPIEGRN